ncbi:hypothetical protein PIB30_111358, partial [Stylosanthes scabra]|nr:hypothetical protein [Stylosanthes scabra]
MFTDFGVRVPFTDFQQRLLNRASVAPSQLHPNAWASIRCFELKGYISVRPTKNQKIFTLYEDSFHDFKGRYFKIFAVGNHRPFWLSLEGDGLFPPYWSDQAGFDIAPIVLPPPPSPKKRRSAVEGLNDPKRVRSLEGGSRDFCPLDRSFDAPGFIESHLLGPRAQEVLRDCDPVESVRWAEWAMIRAATIMKSVEPRLTIAAEAERLNAKLLGDVK